MELALEEDIKMIADRINNEVWAKIGVSQISGIGVIAIRDIPKGTEIAKGQNETNIYYEVTDTDFKKLLEPIRNIILDRSQFETIRFRHPNCVAKLESFMNHSLNPNSNGKVTLKAIKQGEEITKNFLNTDIKLHSFILERYLNEQIN